MVKFFKLKKIYYITNGSYLNQEFTENDFNNSYENLILKIYRKFYGVNTFLEKLNIINMTLLTNKNILFLTSENKLEINLINYVLQLENFNYNKTDSNLIILNLREKKFNISNNNNFKKNISYLSGNNIKVFFSILKEIYDSNIKNINNIINNSLVNLEDIDISSLGIIPTYNKILTNEKINCLYYAFKNNIPPVYK